MGNRDSKIGKRSLSITLIGLLIISSFAVSIAVRPVSAGSSVTTISSVSLSLSSGSYTVTVDGTGFGALPASLPFTGDTGYFRIADAAQTGASEWGYTGDAKQLSYDSWTDTQIVVSEFGGSPGDAITMALWNPTTGAGATWGGNIPPVTSGTPQISSVTFSGSGQTTSMTITGSGFGSAPVSMPFTGDLNYFNFIDFSSHCGASSSEFGAGFNGWGIESPDGVTITFESWSDNTIQISGFGGAYGQGCATANTGDPVVVYVWGTTDTSVTGPQTAWGGPIAGGSSGGGSATWTNLSPSSAPTARSSPAMVYDTADGYTLLFGGGGSAGVLGDTWTFANDAWTQLSPETSPPPREGAAMVYDAADGYVLLFGGYGSSGALGDTWMFKAGVWTQLTPTNSPSARGYSSIAYDAADGYVVLFGGECGKSCVYSDTWKFSAGQWTQLSPSQSPPGREDAGMAYDSTDGYVEMFAGDSNAVSSGAGLDDTWEFAGGSWTQLSPATSPPDMDVISMMANDPAINGVLLYGGWVPAGACGSDYGGTWTFSGGTWTQLSPATSPPAMQASGMAFDSASDNVVLFGGVVNEGASPSSGCGTPSVQGGTWEYGAPSSSTTPVSVSCTPAPIVAGSTSSCIVTVSGSSPTGNVTFSQPSGTGSVFFLLDPACELSYGSCSMTIAGTTPGIVEIEASYGGDSNNAGNSGTTTLTVSNPEQTPGVETISALSNPCGYPLITVYLATGNTCITESDYESYLSLYLLNPAPGTLPDIVGPNCLQNQDGSWSCNSSSATYSTQYVDCLDNGLGLGAGATCDPAGLSTDIISGLVPGGSEISAITAAASLIFNHSPGWTTDCAAVSVATSLVNSLASVFLSLGATVACDALQTTSDSPVNLLVTAPNGQQAGYASDGAEVDQIPGAVLTGPCSLQTDQVVSVTIPCYLGAV